jgi:hypothetical protein
METIYLVSVISDIITEDISSLIINRETTDVIKLTLNVSIDKYINKQQYFLKIIYADRPQVKHKLVLTKNNDKFKFSFYDTGVLILTEKDIHTAKIQEIVIAYLETDWVPIIKSFNSLPKRVFITNLVSFSNSNTHFQLTGAKETQMYLPSLIITCILDLSLILTVVLDDIQYHFNLIKTGHNYSIETPKFIPYTKTGPLILNVSITDADTRKVLWFSQSARFPLSKGLSYIQIELRGYVKQSSYYPVLLIPRNNKNNLEVFNTDLPISKIVVSVYKNTIYSLNYVSQTDGSNKPPTYIGDAGPRKIKLTFKQGDSFTIINASIVLEKAVYYFVNKTLQNELFTLKHQEKRFKEEKTQGPK